MESLHDIDYYEWLSNQRVALLNKDLNAIDWDNIAEEFLEMGNEILKTVNSLLKQIILHKLKLEYSNEIQPRKHWQKEINNFTDQVSDIMTNSLKRKIDLQKIYKRAVKDFLLDYEANLPEECPFDLESLLGND